MGKHNRPRHHRLGLALPGRVGLRVWLGCDRRPARRPRDATCRARRGAGVDDVGRVRADHDLVKEFCLQECSDGPADHRDSIKFLDILARYSFAARACWDDRHVLLVSWSRPELLYRDPAVLLETAECCLPGLGG